MRILCINKDKSQACKKKILKPSKFQYRYSVTNLKNDYLLIIQKFLYF